MTAQTMRTQATCGAAGLWPWTCQVTVSPWTVSTPFLALTVFSFFKQLERGEGMVHIMRAI